MRFPCSRNRWLAIAASAALMASCGCAPEPTPGADTQVIPTPVEVVEYARALNARDVEALAQVVWFPGPQWDGVEPSEPALIPRVCLDAEVGRLGGVAIDIDAITVEKRQVSVTADGETRELHATFEIAWFPREDGSEDGRQLGRTGGRVLVLPEWDNDCEEAAVALFGSPDEG